ncbi:MAG: S8 family serine peptidase, partial [Anaerolineae bacterium]|nr:S8 family serine peptidase [Anaerolineae bacterium]
MQKKYILVPTILLLIFSSLSSPAGSASGADLPAERDHIPGQLVIRTKGPVGKAPEKAALAAQSVNAKSSNIYGNLSLLQFDNDSQAQKALLKLQNNLDIDAVSLNYIYSLGPVIAPAGSPRSGELAAEMLEDGYDPLAYIPDDPKGDNQWHLSKIQYFLTDPPEADPPCIVVIDTGVNYNHKDLTGKVYLGPDFTVEPAGTDPMDLNGHGTHVAGIAAGSTNNTLGIAGVSPNSNILAVRVLDIDGYGSTAGVAAGIEWANAATGADCGGQEPKIYNLSLGGSGDSVVGLAIANAVALDRIVAAAAGNSDESTKTGNYPGANPDTYAVASTEDNNHRSYFSNYDLPGNRWVHIAAPGSSILSTYLTGYRKLSGTSMATPVTAGAAARVWAKYPSLSALEVQNLLVSTAVRTKGFPANTKVVNLYRALGGTLRTIQGEVVNA